MAPFLWLHGAIFSVKDASLPTLLTLRTSESRWWGRRLLARISGRIPTCLWHVPSRRGGKTSPWKEPCSPIRVLGWGGPSPRRWSLRQGGRSPSILLASPATSGSSLRGAGPYPQHTPHNLWCQASLSVCSILFISSRMIPLSVWTHTMMLFLTAFCMRSWRPTTDDSGEGRGPLLPAISVRIDKELGSILLHSNRYSIFLTRSVFHDPLQSTVY